MRLIGLCDFDGRPRTRRKYKPGRKEAMPVVRASAEDDLPAVLAIHNKVIANSTAVYALEPSTLDERGAWFSSRTAMGFPVLVAVDASGDVLGFASFGEWRGARP